MLVIVCVWERWRQVLRATPPPPASATFAQEAWSQGRGALPLPLAYALLVVKTVYISVT